MGVSTALPAANQADAALYAAHHSRYLGKSSKQMILGV